MTEKACGPLLHQVTGCPAFFDQTVTCRSKNFGLKFRNIQVRIRNFITNFWQLKFFKMVLSLEIWRYWNSQEYCKYIEEGHIFQDSHFPSPGWQLLHVLAVTLLLTSLLITTKQAWNMDPLVNCLSLHLS